MRPAVESIVIIEGTTCRLMIAKSLLERRKALVKYGVLLCKVGANIRGSIGTPGPGLRTFVAFEMETTWFDSGPMG